VITGSFFCLAKTGEEGANRCGRAQVLTHCVIVGPSITSSPVSLPKYAALLLAMTAVVSAILSLLIGLPLALLWGSKVKFTGLTQSSQVDPAV
jgi:hypothetical protein